MVPELQKPRITEIQVRMDCNGCVQKIKKTLNGINGIYDMYIDFPQQKITIIGWADPERIVKAIKKTRKIATICSHVEATESPPQTTEQAGPEGNAPAADATEQPPPETPQDQAGPPPEPPKDTPPPEQTPPETTQSLPTENNASQQSERNQGTKDVEEVHVICHHPPNYGGRYGSGHSYDGHWDRHNNSPVFIQEPPRPHNNNPVFIQEPPSPYNNNPVFMQQPPPRLYNNSPVFVQEPPRPYNNNPVLIQQPPPPMYVTHSYNTYRPSPYVTEYEYVRSPPRHTYYNRMEHYGGDYQYQNSNGNITSIFSDENPNACRIV